MAERKYFWLKLKDDFFDEKYIKALRKLPDGDALVIIYLKLQLKSLKTEGFIRYDHIMPSVEEEIALFLDEDVQKVKLALQAIIGLGIAELWDEDTLYMSALQPLIGSEGASAERVRRHREMKALQCNADVTGCNTEKRREDKTERREKKESPPISPLQGERRVFTPPSVGEVGQYCAERCNGIDPQAFVDFYASKGWMIGKNKMKDWKAAVRTWERDPRRVQEQQNKFGGDRLLDMLRTGVFDDE